MGRGAEVDEQRQASRFGSGEVADDELAGAGQGRPVETVQVVAGDVGTKRREVVAGHRGRRGRAGARRRRVGPTRRSAAGRRAAWVMSGTGQTIMCADGPMAARMAKSRKGSSHQTPTGCRVRTPRTAVGTGMRTGGARPAGEVGEGDRPGQGVGQGDDGVGLAGGERRTAPASPRAGRRGRGRRRSSGVPGPRSGPTQWCGGRNW